ncbi:MAG: hypothetical protein J6Y04_08285 [Bacteroidaceae bacterium]|nr:hypothetical protein [Bacteroidaceae bacterium]
MKAFKKLFGLATLAIMMALATSSCATKEHAINQLEDFSYELRDNSAQYSIREWEKAGKKFVKIRKRIAKHELDYTPAEKAEIGELEGKCAGYMANGMRQGVFDKARAFGNELKGIIQGILNTIR